jgi:hypothetical protein
MYKYFFYRLYVWNVSAFGKDDLPVLNALLEISLIVYVNLISIDLVVEALTGFVAINFMNVSKLLIVLIALIILAVNYFVLAYNGKLNRLMEKYGNENDAQREKGNVYLGVYIGISILILFLTLAI